MRNIRLVILFVSCVLVSTLFTGRGLAHDGAHEAPPSGDALAVTNAVRTGSGENTYESVPNWCKIPPGRETLGPTHGGIVADKEGNIYFSMDRGPSAILVYRPDGTFLRGLGDDKLTGIHGLCINDEGDEQFLYAAHLRGKQAIKMKLDGTVVWTVGFDVVRESGKYEDRKQFAPTAVAVGPDGDIYIADGYGQNWIHRIDKDRKYVSSFGGPGTEPGKFKTCHGIGLDRRGKRSLLLVCDRENRRLQHFDLDGAFVAVAAEGLRRPCSVSFHNGRVAVAELEARVTILDEQNRPLTHLGNNPNQEQWANYNVAPADWQPGIFTAPHGVSFDQDGNIYVMDWNASGRVSKFRRMDAETKQPTVSVDR